MDTLVLAQVEATNAGTRQALLHSDENDIIGGSLATGSRGVDICLRQTTMRKAHPTMEESLQALGKMRVQCHPPRAAPAMSLSR